VTGFQTPAEPGSREASPALAQSAHQAVDAARRGDLKSALHIAQHAWQTAREQRDDHGILVATNAASIVHMIRGDSISAVAAAIDTMVLARRLGDRSLQGHALVNLCYAGFDLGTHGDAEADLRKCIEHALADGDGGLEIRARVALGIVLGDVQRFELAPAQFRRALELIKDHPGHTPPACIVANNANLHRKWGAAHLAEGRETEARMVLIESVRLATEAFKLALHEEGIPAGIDALGTRAWALELLGERDKALALLSYAASLGGATGSRPAMLWVLCELGRIRFLAEDLDGARAAFNRALDVASGLRPCASISVACSGLAEVEAKLGHGTVAEQWKARAIEESADFERWRRDTRWQLERFLGET